MHTNETNPPVPVLTPRVPAVPWGWHDLFWAIVLAASGIVVLNLGVVALSAMIGSQLRENGIVLALFVIAQDALVFGAAWLFSVARYRVNWNTLGLRAFAFPMGCGLSAALLMASYAIRFCYVVTLIGLGINPQMQTVIPRLDTSGIGLLITFVAVAIFAPVVEEVFFRGFLYGGMRGRIGMGGALVGSALFFTALHFTLDQFIPIFILGLFLAWLYEKTGSLYPGICLHIANNALALVALMIIRATGLVPI